MKNLLISLMISAGFIISAHAADIEDGKTQSVMCAACHGADGNSAVPMWPKLASQGVPYLVKQLIDIRDGERSVPEMVPFVMGKTDQDFENIATFFSAQAIQGGAADEKLVALGERIYRGGNAEKGIPACLACHGPQGTGIAQAKYPHLAGQHADYTKAQLTKFSMGERTNDGDARIMRDIAERMHTKEIEAVSSYIQGLR